MYHNHAPLIRYGMSIAVLGLGALMLLPGSDASPRASSGNGDDLREARRYLAAPDLVEQLDAMLVPAASDQVLIQEMRLPEPTLGANDPWSDRALSATQQPASASTDARPDEALVPARRLRVGDQWINLRTGPSTTTEIIRTLRPGAALTMTETHRGWVSVVTESGESGWAHSAYLTGPTQPDAGNSESPIQVAEAGEGRDAGRLGPERHGDRLEVSEVRDGWARTVLRSGAIEWVRVR